MVDLTEQAIEAEKETRRKAGRPSGSPNKNYEYKKKEREKLEATKALWKKGILYWKLDANQRIFRDMYYNHGNWTTLPCLWARQIGKSWAVCTIINEEAIQKPGTTMAYIAPKLNQAKKIVNTKFRELLVDCPEELRPKFNSIENKWTWPNGSELYLAGTDNQNAENIRGSTFNRVFVDEFCFLDDFEYVMNSIIFPTMMSVSDPLMVLISSPPKTMDHESNKWLDEAEHDGRLIRRTIYDCPRHSKEKIERIIREQYHNDPNSTDFRRECLCERIADSSKLVLPEATADRIKKCVLELVRPDFFTITEAFDWGAGDKNAGLYSYANYDDKIIVIEDEMWLSDNQYTTADIACEIRKIEKRLWEENSMKNRYGDNNNGQLLIDMAVMHNLPILATKKDGLIAAVNHVRQLLKNGQIIIHPRCVNLIKQIQSCTWLSSEKKKFSHKTEKDENNQEYKHHYDLVAALIYLVRNSNMDVSPYPIDYDLLKRGYHRDTHFLSPKREQKNQDGLSKFLSDKFTIRKKR